MGKTNCRKDRNAAGIAYFYTITVKRPGRGRGAFFHRKRCGYPQFIDGLNSGIMTEFKPTRKWLVFLVHYSTIKKQCFWLFCCLFWVVFLCPIWLLHLKCWKPYRQKGFLCHGPRHYFPRTTREIYRPLP